MADRRAQPPTALSAPRTRPAGDEPAASSSRARDWPAPTAPAALSSELPRPAASWFRGEKWTQERLGVLIALYPTKRHINDIVAALNCLLGPPVTHQQTFDAARRLNLHRPAALKFSRGAPPIAPKGILPIGRVGPIEATPLIIAIWAAEHAISLTTGDDLARVNRVRRDAGLREFKIVRPRGEYVEC